jgi:predicted ATPase
MITHLKVDGFRSLSRFEMAVNPGLNILVGPNGSGKTNIVSFLQFLSYLTTNPLSDAIAKAGGAGAVFQKIGSGQYRKALNAEIHGTYRYSPEDRYFPVPPGANPRRRVERVERRPATIRYEFTFELAASVDLDAIAYERQILSVWKSIEGEKALFQDDRPDFQVILRCTEGEEPTIQVEHIADEKFDTGLRLRSSQDSVQADEYLKHFLGRGDEFIIPRLASFISDFRYLRADFSGGEIFNIIPSQARLPEDSAKTPLIQSDGSGLAATLYALQKNPRRAVARTPFEPVRRALPPGTFAQIIRYMQTVNEAIVDLSVRNDPFDNQLKVGVKISGENGEIELPFSSMSDGTVKWASLITAILTYETIFAIEEPENFLHPLMQREILQIMRENVQRRGGQSFVMMTTHSETLLNAADPHEVVVVSISDGITHAKRPEDPGRLFAEIQRSGFGLGYAYVSGALDHA